MVKGVIHSYGSGGGYDPQGDSPGDADNIDRGGTMNLLTSSRWISKNCPGMAPNSCLAEIEKWEGAE
jgi:trimethylamine-N-oxide reductase (cytochrome c)